MTTFKLKIKIKSPCIHFEDFQAQVRCKFAALNLLDSKIDALNIKESSQQLKMFWESHIIKNSAMKELLNLCDEERSTQVMKLRHRSKTCTERSIRSYKQPKSGISE